MHADEIGALADRDFAAGPEMSPAPAGIVDIAPTILDLLGVAPAASMRGTSLVSVAQAEPPEAETHEVSAGDFRQRLTVVRRNGHLFPRHGQRVA